MANSLGMRSQSSGHMVLKQAFGMTNSNSRSSVALKTIGWRHQGEEWPVRAKDCDIALRQEMLTNAKKTLLACEDIRMFANHSATKRQLPLRRSAATSKKASLQVSLLNSTRS